GRSRPPERCEVARRQREPLDEGLSQPRRVFLKPVCTQLPSRFLEQIGQFTRQHRQQWRRERGELEVQECPARQDLTQDHAARYHLQFRRHLPPPSPLPHPHPLPLRFA